MWNSYLACSDRILGDLINSRLAVILHCPEVIIFKPRLHASDGHDDSNLENSSMVIVDDDLLLSTSESACYPREWSDRIKFRRISVDPV